MDGCLVPGAVFFRKPSPGLWALRGTRKCSGERFLMQRFVDFR